MSPVHLIAASVSPSVTPTTSTSSTFPSAPRTPARSPAPYRPGFQPKGVYRPRTDEFVESRNRSRDLGRIERTRLERRLEKLINLHFHPPGQRKVEVPEPRPVKENRRASSFWDLDLSDLKNKSAGDLWREVLQSQASQSGKDDVRGTLGTQQNACIVLCDLWLQSRSRRLLLGRVTRPYRNVLYARKYCPARLGTRSLMIQAAHRSIRSPTGNIIVDCVVVSSAHSR